MSAAMSVSMSIHRAWRFPSTTRDALLTITTFDQARVCGSAISLLTPFLRSFRINTRTVAVGAAGPADEQTNRSTERLTSIHTTYE